MSLDDDIILLREELQKENEVMLKIAFFGQPGAGKSSLINKLINRKSMKTGSETDTTMEKGTCGWRGLQIIDLPGYDTMKFPKETYFDEFNILSFDLLICVFSEKFHQADNEFFRKIKSEGKTCIFVRNKHDALWNDDGKTIDEIEKEITNDVIKQIQSQEKVYFTSCRTNHGLKELSEAIFRNLDTTKRSKWIETAKAYSTSFLDKKKKLCEKAVYISAGLAATNGINPIPGFDVSIDITVLLGLFHKIRNIFGLSDDVLKSKQVAILKIANVMKFVTKEGLIFLLKKYSQRMATKEVSKFIPFVGPVIAASVGFGITLKVGNKYLEDCYDVANSVLKIELGHNG